MSDPCTIVPTEPCVPAVADERVLESFYRRNNTAKRQALVPIPPHTTNGDEALGDKCGTYTKALKQMSAGKVDLTAYEFFRAALTNAATSGTFAALEGVTLGGTRTLNGPMGAYASTFFGADSSQFGDAPPAAPIVPPPPAVASQAYATELVELYWCSLLRDVAFTDYHKSPIAKAAAQELSALPNYQGPVDGGEVTPALLFRGNFSGETTGPYISQFFVTPTMLGAQPVDQRYVTYKAGVDYMTDQPTWEAVQNGIPTGVDVQKDPKRRYLHNGRGLAAFTRVDELFQAYFTAHLVLSAINAPNRPPFNPGNPYIHSVKQNGFGTFGGADIASVLAQVAKIALNAVWYQKWIVHLRHRPESGGGLVHLIKNGVGFDCKPDPNVLNSKAVKRSYETYGSYLLSQAFPEGSPAHPAYPTGHGTVGGACITILKFFYDGDFTFSDPQVPNSNGTKLKTWTYDPSIEDSGTLTVNGELHKLAHNVTFGHGLHAGIHWRSDSDVSMILGEAVAISFLEDLACTYAEPFKVNFTKLDGSVATITNM